MKEEIWFLLKASLCVASISYTVTWAGIFKSLREKVSSWGNWFDELIHCPYCFGHYVTIVYLCVFGRNVFLPFTLDSVLKFFVYLFSIMTLVGIMHWVMLKAYTPVADMLAYRKIKSRKNETD